MAKPVVDHFYTEPLSVFPEFNEPDPSITEYVDIIKDTVTLGKNIMLAKK